MRANRRGYSLVELIFAMGLGLVVIGIGYKSYFGVTRADEIQARREAVTLTVQNLMGRIKHDTRAASSAAASGASLALDGGRIRYRSLPNGAGVERATRYGRGVYRDVAASFSGGRGGVNVRLISQTRVHRRPIRIDVATFVSTRNR